MRGDGRFSKCSERSIFSKDCLIVLLEYLTVLLESIDLCDKVYSYFYHK